MTEHPGGAAVTGGALSPGAPPVAAGPRAADATSAQEVREFTDEDRAALAHAEHLRNVLRVSRVAAAVSADAETRAEREAL